MKFKLVESNEDRQKLIDHVGPDLADKFFRIKHDIHEPKKRDLYYWLKRNPKELSDYLYKFDKKEGCIRDDADWAIYNISSPEMLSNLVGRHKIWCIQNTDSGLDWNYHVGKKNTKYQLYIDKKNNKKYIRGINADDFMEDGIWDENNRTVHDKEILSRIPLTEILKPNGNVMSKNIKVTYYVRSPFNEENYQTCVVDRQSYLYMLSSPIYYVKHAEYVDEEPTLQEAFLNRADLEKIRIKMARDIYVPATSIMIHENGRFEIYNVDEYDKNRIVSRLRMSNYCDQVNATAGQYDFGHFTGMGQPKQKYNISGIIDIDNI